MKVYGDIQSIPMDKHIIETHSHIFPVSPCSELDYQEIIDIYEDAGYSGLSLTDHYNIDFDTRYRHFHSNSSRVFSEYYKSVFQYAEDKQLRVMFGFELKFSPEETSDVYRNAEFLVYGTIPDFLDRYPHIYKCRTVQEGLCVLKNLLQKEYGENHLIIQAHPLRTEGGILKSDCLDGMELFNGTDTAQVRYSKLCLSGSDAHVREHCCRNGIVLSEWDFSVEDYIEQLRARKYDIFAHGYKKAKQRRKGGNIFETFQGR